MPGEKLNEKQFRALKRYADSGQVKYPFELSVRASTARALSNRGLLKQVFDHNHGIYIHDWSKYIIAPLGQERLKESR